MLLMFYLFCTYGKILRFVCGVGLRSCVLGHWTLVRFFLGVEERLLRVIALRKSIWEPPSPEHKT